MPDIATPHTDAERRALSAVSDAVAERATASAAIGADIHRLRKRAGLTGTQLAAIFGWGRDAISKLETGKNDTYLYDYLKIVRALQRADPGHPAVALAEMLIPPSRSRRI